MTVYADTNYLTRAYLSLPESEVAAELVARAERADMGPLPVNWLHRIEFCNALQLHVYQGRQIGRRRVTGEQAAAALAKFREDLAEGKVLRAAAVAVEELERQAEELSLRHTAKHGFKTYDLVHVASAILLGCNTFWSFDPKASRLAELEGLATVQLS